MRPTQAFRERALFHWRRIKWPLVVVFIAGCQRKHETVLQYAESSQWIVEVVDPIEKDAAISTILPGDTVQFGTGAVGADTPEPLAVTFTFSNDSVVFIERPFMEPVVSGDVYSDGVVEIVRCRRTPSGDLVLVRSDADGRDKVVLSLRPVAQDNISVQP